MQRCYICVCYHCLECSWRSKGRLSWTVRSERYVNSIQNQSVPCHNFVCITLIWSIFTWSTRDLCFTSGWWHCCSCIQPSGRHVERSDCMIASGNSLMQVMTTCPGRPLPESCNRQVSPSSTEEIESFTFALDGRTTRVNIDQEIVLPVNDMCDLKLCVKAQKLKNISVCCSCFLLHSCKKHCYLIHAATFDT